MYGHFRTRAVALLGALLLVVSSNADLYDDFEDGVVSATSWSVLALNGHVTEQGGYMEIWGGPLVNPHDSNTGEASAVAIALDLKTIADPVVTIEMDWWRNYVAGYNSATLSLTDGADDVIIKEFCSALANSESGGGLFTLLFSGATARLFEDGVAVTEDIDVSSLDSYHLKFRCWENQPFGAWITIDPTWPHVTYMRVHDVTYTPEPSTFLMLMLCGLAALE